MCALYLARLTAFVAIHTGVVHLYMRWLHDTLPPLRDEPRSLLLWPATFLAGIAFAGMYPLVKAARTHVARAGIVVGFGAATMVVLAMWVIVQTGPQGDLLSLFAIFLGAIMFETLYGAPLVFAVALLAVLLGPLLIGPLAARERGE